MSTLALTRDTLRIAAVAALLAGCGVLRQAQDDMQPPIGAPAVAVAPHRIAVATRQASTSGHLYVADFGSGAIYRYSLVNGLPNKLPDETFAHVAALQLGVDGSGSIYAAAASMVEKYSKNGKLMGYFTVPQHTSVLAFAVDRGGYTYVVLGYDYERQVSVYGPEAYRTHGMAKSIAALSADGSSLRFLATDSAGRLYGAAYDAIDIWNHPHHSALHENERITPPSLKINNSATFSQALAFDEHHTLYASIAYSRGCYESHRYCKTQYWQGTDFDAITDWLKPTRTDHMIYAGECFVSYSSGIMDGYVQGIAVSGGYLEAACIGDRRGVWVYRSDRFRRQYAVEALDGLRTPVDVKVGP